MWTACSTKESSASTCAFQSGYIEKIDVCGRWRCVPGSAIEKTCERNDACQRRTRWRLWRSSGNNPGRCLTTGHDDGEKGGESLRCEAHDLPAYHGRDVSRTRQRLLGYSKLRCRTPAVGIVQPRHWRDFGNRHTQNADPRMTHDTPGWPREARPTVDGGATASSRTKLQPLFLWLCLKSVGPAWRPLGSQNAPTVRPMAPSHRCRPSCWAPKTSIGYKVRHEHGHSGACLKLMLADMYMAWSHKRHRIKCRQPRPTL